MICPKHGIKMTPLFTSMACDMCDAKPGTVMGTYSPILATDKHGYCGLCGALPTKKFSHAITDLSIKSTFYCPNGHQWDVTTNLIDDLIVNMVVAASKP